MAAPKRMVRAPRTRATRTDTPRRSEAAKTTAAIKAAAEIRKLEELHPRGAKGSRMEEWSRMGKEKAGQAARRGGTQIARRLGGAATRVAGPAAVVGSTLGGPSQAPRQTERQLASARRRGVEIERTKGGGYRTTTRSAQTRAPKRVVSVPKEKKPPAPARKAPVEKGQAGRRMI